MPYRKYKKSPFAGIKENAFGYFVKLAEDVSVGKHYALWSSCCSGSKNYCRKVIYLSLVKFLFNNIRVFLSPCMTLFLKITELKTVDALFLALCFYFIRYRIERNDCVQSRNIFLYVEEFLYLGFVFRNADMNFRE